MAEYEIYNEFSGKKIITYIKNNQVVNHDKSDSIVKIYANECNFIFNCSRIYVEVFGTRNRIIMAKSKTDHFVQAIKLFGENNWVKVPQNTMINLRNTINYIAGFDKVKPDVWYVYKDHELTIAQT